jgi:hypothetical protein
MRTQPRRPICALCEGSGLVRRRTSHVGRYIIEPCPRLPHKPPARRGWARWILDHLRCWIR